MKNRGAKFWQGGSIPLIAPEILGDIITDVADVGIVISDNGTILSALINPLHEEFRSLENWEGEDFRDTLTDECVQKFDARLGKFVPEGGPVRPLELNHLASAADLQFPIRYTFHRIGPSDAILLLGRDLRPIAEVQQQLVNAQIALERDHEARRGFDARFRILMDATTEPVLFLKAKTGKITDANDAAAEFAGKVPSGSDRVKLCRNVRAR